jgi:Phosphotransferase enzyme family
MPERFDEAVAAVEVSLAGRDRGDGDVLREVMAPRETYRSWCERLATAPGRGSIDHNDLHPWNMLVPRPDRPDEVRFYDWGDAVIAHSFACSSLSAGRSGGSRAASTRLAGDLPARRECAPLRPPMRPIESDILHPGSPSRSDWSPESVSGEEALLHDTP